MRLIRFHSCLTALAFSMSCAAAGPTASDVRFLVQTSGSAGVSYFYVTKDGSAYQTDFGDFDAFISSGYSLGTIGCASHSTSYQLRLDPKKLPIGLEGHTERSMFELDPAMISDLNQRVWDSTNSQFSVIERTASDAGVVCAYAVINSADNEITLKLIGTIVRGSRFRPVADHLYEVYEKTVFEWRRAHRVSKSCLARGKKSTYYRSGGCDPYLNKD